MSRKFGSQVLEPLTTSMRLLRSENKSVETKLKTQEESKESISKYKKSLSDAKDKLVNELTKIRKNDRITDLIDGIVEHYQCVSDNEIEKYNKQKDVQKANALINKFSVIGEIQKIMGEKKNTPSVEVANDKPADAANTANSQGAINDNLGKQIPTVKSEFDAYSGLTTLEKSIVKKVYKILDGQKDLAPSIREKLKAKMEKRLTKK